MVRHGLSVVLPLPLSSEDTAFACGLPQLPPPTDGDAAAGGLAGQLAVCPEFRSGAPIAIGHHPRQHQHTIVTIVSLTIILIILILSLTIIVILILIIIIIFSS